MEHLRLAWLSLIRMPRKTGTISLEEVSGGEKMIREGLLPLSFRKKASHTPIEEEKEIDEFLANLSFPSQFFFVGGWMK